MIEIQKFVRKFIRIEISIHSLYIGVGKVISLISNFRSRDLRIYIPEMILRYTTKIRFERFSALAVS